MLGGAVLHVRPSGEEVPLRPFERRVLAAAAFEPRREVSLQRMESLVWAQPPATARKALQTHVARIRAAAGPDLLLTTTSGYRLGDDVELDRLQLQRAVETSASPTRGADVAARRAQLLDALARWRGAPYADLRDEPDVRTVREQLREQRRTAEERLAECRLVLGEVDDAVVGLERLVAEEPYRERRWWLLMLALYRAGRRRDGLAAFARARATLNEGVGLEPGEPLVSLERRLLADDPSLLAASVLEPPGPASADDTRLPPRTFVGRSQELAAVGTALDAAASDESRLVLCVGAPGIGKTVFARSVAAEAAARGHAVAWTACEQAPARPLQPFEDVVAALVRHLGVAQVVSLAGPAAASLAPLLPGAADGEVQVELGMGPALRRLLAAAAAERPLLVVVDDAQWAPPATLRFVADLPSAGPAITVLALARPGTVEQRWHDVAHDLVELAPLDEDDTARLVASVLGGDLSADAVAHEVWTRSGGHPLLAHELTTALVAQRSLRVEDDRWTLDRRAGLPATVAELVQERVAELGPDAVQVLQAAAVLGPTFDLDVLDGLVPRAADGVRDGVRAGVLVDPGVDGMLAFGHDLTHEAVLEGVPEGWKVELHEAAGLALAADPDAPPLEVARHLVAAAPLDLERAVEAASAAGRAAADVFAHDLAVAQHRAAHDLLASAGRLETAQGCDVLTALGDAERLAGEDGCRAHLEQAAAVAEQLGDGDRLAAAAWSLIQLGPTTRSGSTDEEAARIAARALDLVRSPELRSRVAGAASLLHSMTDDPARCRSLYELAVSEATALGGDRLLGDVLPYAFLALGGPDDLEERRAASALLDEVSERLGDPVTRFEALHLRFSVLMLCGEDGLEAALAEMEELSDRIVDPGRRWALGYQRSALALLRGDPDASEALAAEALAEAEDVFQERAVAAYGVQLLAVRAAQGRLAELAPLIDQVLADQPGLSAWHAARAWVAAAAGDEERVRHEVDVVAADGFTSLPKDFTWTAAMHSVVTAAALVGDADRADAARHVLAPCSGRFTWAGTSSFGPVDQALAEAALAAGDHAAALRHATVAADLARRARAPLHLLAAERIQGRLGGEV